MQRLKRTWAEIDLDALAHNFKLVKDMVGPEVSVMAVVKADGYGHGSVEAARVFDACGADFFGVSNVMEAKPLRKGGITKPILVLGHTPAENAAQLVEYDVTQALLSREYASQLSAAAGRIGASVKVHVKLDTGMSRIGYSALDAKAAAAEIELSLSGSRLDATGIFTHFAVADEFSERSVAFTREQFSRFSAVVDELEGRGITFKYRHCCNSAGTLFYPEYRLDMVRPGVILYGVSPNGQPRGCEDFKPAMSLKSVVALVKTIHAGDTVSYGRRYEAGSDVRVATVPVGYADGYPRSLSGKGIALVNGKPAPVIGTVCMDQLMLDVTGIDVKEGDEVTLFGGRGEVSVDNIAALAGTISYELLCDVSRRVQRAYIKDGKVSEVVDYTDSDM